MALLQIAEPGQSAAPHEKKLAIGIDLGTTNSLVATVRSGQPKVITDGANAALVPSIVHYGESEILVGDTALQQVAVDPENTIVSVKRLMGRSRQEVSSGMVDSPYRLSERQDNLPFIETAQGAKNPVEISASILNHLAKRAEEGLGEVPHGAVITVPAHFDDAQRQATKDAAKLAGLHVLRLINEPTAAAIAYGLDSRQEGVIAVYDLGGGTFDISILKLQKGVFEVQSTGGDTALGGDDFDQLIIQWIKQHLDADINITKQQQAYLRQLAKSVKEQLSEQDDIVFSVELGEQQLALTFSNKQFADLSADLLKKTLRSCRRAMKDAGVDKDEISQVVMVGGSTRMPIVRHAVADYFGCQPLTSIDPDQVVALGASIQADILIGNRKDDEVLLLDVIPLSLGIETMGGLVEKIIPRNTTIPVARAQEFTTFKDGQTAMVIHVLQGEREMVDDCRSLARFTLTDIPPMAAGAAHIRITFQVDADGLLQVTAMEKINNKQTSIEVKPSYGLDESQITQMLTQSMENAEQDMNRRMLVEQQVEADRVMEALTSAIREDGGLLSTDAQQRLLEGLKLLAEVRNGEDKQLIKQTIEHVDELSQELAQKRMDKTIKTALAGQSVDEV